MEAWILNLSEIWETFLVLQTIARDVGPGLKRRKDVRA